LIAPGGFVNQYQNENSFCTAQRELFEETSLKIEAANWRYLYHYQADDNVVGVNRTVTFFSVNIPYEQSLTAEAADDFTAIRWVDVKNIGENKMVAKSHILLINHIDQPNKAASKINYALHQELAEPFHLIELVEQNNEDASSMIKAGVNVNHHRQKDGLTALMIAFSQRNIPLAAMLIEAHADMTLYNYQQKMTTIDYAKEGDLVKLTPLLPEKKQDLLAQAIEENRNRQPKNEHHSRTVKNSLAHKEPLGLKG